MYELMWWVAREKMERRRPGGQCGVVEIEVSSGRWKMEGKKVKSSSGR